VTPKKAPPETAGKKVATRAAKASWLMPNCTTMKMHRAISMASIAAADASSATKAA